MVNKYSATPLYIQVCEELRNEIINMQYGEDGRLETQYELSKRFNVSPITIKKSIQVLESEGLIEVRQGKGTFVKNRMFVDKLENLTGISTMLQQSDEPAKGHEVEVDIFKVIDTPEYFDQDIKEALGNRCTHVRRIVKYKGIRTCCADMYLPEKMGTLLSKEEIEKETVYQLYQRKLGIKLGKGRQKIRARGASKEIAECLSLHYNDPVLELERRAYDQDNVLIEYMILTYECNAYCYEVELQIHGGSIYFPGLTQRSI